MAKQDIPINGWTLASEYLKYQGLCFKYPLSNTSGTWTSSSSGTTYTYTNDSNLMSQLKNILQNYLVTASEYNDIITKLNNIVSMKRNELKSLLGRTSRFQGVNSWFDTLDNDGWLDTNNSSGYSPVSGNLTKDSSMHYNQINTIDSCIYTASYTMGTGFEPSKAFDGDINTRWQSESDKPFWLQIQLPNTQASRVCNWMRLYINCNHSGGTINYTIQGSNDASSWNTLNTGSIVGGYSYQQVDVLLTSNTIPYKYYKILNSTNSSYALMVYEWQFYEGWYFDHATVVWKPITSEGILSKAIIEADTSTLSSSNNIQFYISRDGGTTFESSPISLDTATDLSATSGTSVVLKALITGNAQLNGVAWGGLV